MAQLRAQEFLNSQARCTRLQSRLKINPPAREGLASETEMSELGGDSVNSQSEPTKHQFHCPKCPKTFKSSEALRCHLYRSGCGVSAKPTHQCQDCRKKFYQGYDLQQHQTKTCPSRKKDLNQQTANETQNAESGSCLTVKQVLESSSTTNDAGSSTTCDDNLTSEQTDDERVTCPVCSKTVMNVECLRKHLYYCGVAPQYECTDCLKKFRHKSDLIRHQIKSCPAAKKKRMNDTVASRSNKDLSSKSKEKNCSTCLKLLMSISRVRSHICRVKKVFECDYCRRKFTKKRDITRHIERSACLEKKMSDVGPANRYNSKTAFETNSPVKCANCFKMFAHRDSLDVHLRLSRCGQFRGFQCKYCCKNYMSQRTLENHELRQCIVRKSQLEALKLKSSSASSEVPSQPVASTSASNSNEKRQADIPLVDLTAPDTEDVKSGILGEDTENSLHINDRFEDDEEKRLRIKKRDRKKKQYLLELEILKIEEEEEKELLDQIRNKFKSG